MDHGKRLIEVTGEGRLEGMDWGEVRPYVMFITGRCGSTWLTELLTSTGIAGHPREWLNSDVARYSGALTDSLSGYFSNIVERFSFGARFGIQVDPVRLKDTRSWIDWSESFPVDLTSTFFLYRRDLVAQAWSWVHARKSGIWHSTDPRRKDQPESPIHPDYSPTTRELVDEIVALRRREEYLCDFWAELGYRPRFIEYETLAADPSATVADILRDLGATAEEIDNCAGERETKSKRLSYDDSKTRDMLKFTHLNHSVLAALDRDRFGIGSEFLAQRLIE